jgi:branched-subunit amino acid transport protein
MFAAGLWPALIPIVAAIFVVIVARLTKSLLWSAIVGVVTFAILLLI